MANLIKITCVTISSVVIIFWLQLVDSAPPVSQQNATCKRELESANKSLSLWGENLESMINESKLPGNSRESIHKAANQVLDMIEDFGQQLNSRSPLDLASDLVNIRRQSNRLALEVYLNTFDMRWPHTSLQLGITVERVQQACLSRNAIVALESPKNPLDFLGLNLQ